MNTGILLNQARIQQNMTTITITYNQNDATNVETVLRSLQIHFTIKEVPSKKCLQAIPGLVSRSFSGSPEIFSNANLEFLQSKCLHTNKSIFSLVSYTMLL